MALYPSFESLTIGKEVKAQNEFAQSLATSVRQDPSATVRANYGELAMNFLGLDLSRVIYDQYGNAIYPDPSCPETAVASAPGSAVAPPPGSAIAAQPGLSGPLVKLNPAIVTNAVRELTLQKDKKGRLGIQLRDLDGGIIVSYVECEGGAALSGLRFGDQVLSINGVVVAGFSGPKAMDLVKQSPSTVVFVIRDRPLERNVTLTKSSSGTVGIVVKHGKVSAIVKDSSAARNGVLINNHILEVNGRNVIGMSDKRIANYLDSIGPTINITLMPSFFYDHLIKKLGRSDLKNMDRSAPVV
ncbi:unnamed protein product [Dibothriocephalus latus]|uniref:PDZ domain-containing protein n=1 Tax=Dibothriocephalus latus TaxID=60516 RepID=A0A3P7M0T2_DIBLA|nr:unnamed protein product [Dibothriocephalus latus]